MKCPICQSGAAKWAEFREILILQCSAYDCGFRFFDLSKWRSPYEGTDYYSDWDSTAGLNFEAPFIKERVNIVRRFKRSGTVAELGCGIGETAIAFQRQGFETTGVEESPTAIKYLRANHPELTWAEINILDFLRGHDRVFDVITMFHVLEHIPDPKAVIRSADSALRPDGLLVIEVPDAGGGIARLRGSSWEYVLDHHVNYFDRKSLHKLMGLFGYRLRYLQRTYHFSHPQGDLIKDLIKGTLAFAGLNSIVRTTWSK